MSACFFPTVLGGLTLPSFTPPGAWTASTVYAIGAKVTNDGKLYECAVGGTSAAPGPTHTSGTVADGGGVQWLAVTAPALPALISLVLSAPPCALDVF